MTNLIVKNEIENVKQLSEKYAAGLILSLKRKSCVKIAEVLELKHA